MSLKLIAAELLFSCPGYRVQYGDAQSLCRDIYVPGEITRTALAFKRPVQLYTSTNNPGAREVADILHKAMAGLELATAAPPEATHFLLYLSSETFVGEAGERLADEVRLAMQFKQSFVMLHENDMKNGGCVSACSSNRPWLTAADKNFPAHIVAGVRATILDHTPRSDCGWPV